MHPISGKRVIMVLLLPSQCFVFGVFIRYATVRMILVYPLISRVCFHAYLTMNMYPALFKHPEIMFSSLVCVHTDDRAIPGYDQLDLVGMPLSFAGVVLSLFFLGLSTGLSPTSTSTTDHFTLALVSAFLPGKRNAPL